MTSTKISVKKLKDPIYGYIAIQKDFIEKVIDTAPYQRLRRIVQTSYAPVFASAVHNRFVHSLGVYHLGRMAGETLKTEIVARIETLGLELDQKKLDDILEVFLLACLLHDVGHAPFSHTGEKFYAKPGRDVSELHKILKKLVGKPDFTADMPKNGSEAAAPHEIVSAIVGIKEFRKMFKPETEFFARCITGYQYKKLSTENSIRNCFIQMLNSKLIDVDKLDYLIRDAYITGYESTKIDYPRLLGALTVIFKDGVFAVAYRKGAVSVIENVVYAHDSERKWIQTHPVILYENYLLNHIFKALEKKLNTSEARLFSPDALSTEGVKLKDGKDVRLLSDDDIIHLMKELYAEDQLVREYFHRDKRRHPVWKSEAEYRLLFEKRPGTNGEIFRKLQESLNAMVNYLDNTDNGIINNKLIDDLKEELKRLESQDGLDPETRARQMDEKCSILKTVECLLGKKAGCGKEGCVLLKADQFSSGFRKFAAVNSPFEIRIVLNDDKPDESVSFNELVVSLDSRIKSNTDLFYLYSRVRRPAADISSALIQNSAKAIANG